MKWLIESYRELSMLSWFIRLVTGINSLSSLLGLFLLLLKNKWAWLEIIKENSESKYLAERVIMRRRRNCCEDGAVGLGSCSSLNLWWSTLYFDILMVARNVLRDVFIDAFNFKAWKFNLKLIHFLISWFWNEWTQEGMIRAFVVVLEGQKRSSVEWQMWWGRNISLQTADFSNTV